MAFDSAAAMASLGLGARVNEVLLGPENGCDSCLRASGPTLEVSQKLSSQT